VLTIDIITIFPEYFQGPLSYGMVRQAQKKELLEIHLHDLRQFTSDRHKTVDDRPFGGGEGMVLKPEPLFQAVRQIQGESAASAPKVILLSPQGRKLDPAIAFELSQARRLVLICGRYEGVDERVSQHLVSEEISIGDFILSGGEIAACVLIECVVRFIPGVLNNSNSATNESFMNGQTGPASEPLLLDCPQYTRPEDWGGMKVPEVLLSGHHHRIQLWRRKKSIEKTLKNRPDLLKYEGLSEKDRQLLAIDLEKL
jgi:tRNA (guanine37-N1)-methyltransferase